MESYEYTLFGFIIFTIVILSFIFISVERDKNKMYKDHINRLKCKCDTLQSIIKSIKDENKNA